MVMLSNCPLNAQVYTQKSGLLNFDQKSLFLQWETMQRYISGQNVALGPKSNTFINLFSPCQGSISMEEEEAERA